MQWLARSCGRQGGTPWISATGPLVLGLCEGLCRGQSGPCGTSVSGPLGRLVSPAAATTRTPPWPGWLTLRPGPATFGFAPGNASSGPGGWCLCAAVRRYTLRRVRDRLHALVASRSSDLASAGGAPESRTAGSPTGVRRRLQKSSSVGGSVGMIRTRPTTSSWSATSRRQIGPRWSSGHSGGGCPMFDRFSLARVGIEPTSRDFAGRCITARLPRRSDETLGSSRALKSIASVVKL